MYLIKWYFYSLIYLFQIKRTFSKKRWILSRTACLVNDTYEILNLKKDHIYNIQKGRVDFLNRYFSGSFQSPSLALINCIIRTDIRKLFIQQKFFRLPKINKPSLFILDSFSELVDKQFEGVGNYHGIFNAYFSDVEKNKVKQLKSYDLIPEVDIYDAYLTFFTSFRNYSSCPILFVFFPSELEKRETYLNRANEIYVSIKKIENLISDFHTIEIPKQMVKHAKNDSNPYHFDKSVYLFLADEIKNKNLIRYL